MIRRRLELAATACRGARVTGAWRRFSGALAIVMGCFLLGIATTARAQEPPAASPAGSPRNEAPLDYVLALGPYGALLWGAYRLGQGMKLTICVELSDKDRELLAGTRRPVAA